MKLYFETFWTSNSELILTVAYNAVLVIIIFFVSHFCVKFIHRWINKTNEKYEQFDETLLPMLHTAANLMVYSVVFVIILDFLGVDSTSIITILGATGLAVALALRETLSNIAAGIMLIILRPFRVEHYIECGSLSGTIKHVGLFTTILETPDGLYISAPNSSLWGSPIINYTKNGKRRMNIIVGISYTDSIETGFEALRTVINKEPRFLSDPPPQMMVQAMADSSVNLQFRAWTRVENYWEVYWETNKKIKDEIQASGLTIPFPQMDVYFHNEKNMDKFPEITN